MVNHSRTKGLLHFYISPLVIIVFTAQGAMSSLEEAERKIISALQSAAAAFRALGTADSMRAGSFDAHSEAFLRGLADVQGLVRASISALGTDLPLENGSMRHLIEGDMAAQRTAHAHDILKRTLDLVPAHVAQADPPHSENAAAVGVTYAAPGIAIGADDDMDIA
jgi:hypothetical protein